MIAKISLCLALIASPLWAFRKIPETIPVGGYSVSLRCDEKWAVEVFEKPGVVAYSYVDTNKAVGVAFQLTVYRIRLPVDASLADETELANRLVRDDGLKFKQPVFQRPVRLPKEPELVACPIGNAYVYAPDRAVFSDRVPHFARAALLLPNGFRSRLVAYLIVGHQAGGGLVSQEQAEYFSALLQGIREKEPDQPAGTQTAATTRSPVSDGH